MTPRTFHAQHRNAARDDAGKSEKNVHAEDEQEQRCIRRYLDSGNDDLIAVH
jgi:hypothetical protein